MLSNTSMLVGDVKMLLLKCFEEGVDIDDVSIQTVRSHIGDVKKNLNIPLSVMGFEPTLQIENASSNCKEIEAPLNEISTSESNDAKDEACSMMLDISFCLPPVMRLIDDITSLQSDIQSCESNSDGLPSEALSLVRNRSVSTESRGE